MTSILILIVILLLTLGGGAAAWFVFRRRQAVKETAAKQALSFRWTYIMLPAAILILSVVLGACFYCQLPAEVAYNFNPGSSPDKWFSREMMLVWMLLPQLILTFLAAAITWGIAKLSASFSPAGSPWIKLGRTLSLMGNIVALPQIIFCFALVDIFRYNSYQTHIMPLWVFAVIIMVVGAILLSISFVSAIRQARGTLIALPDNKTKE